MQISVCGETLGWAWLQHKLLYGAVIIYSGIHQPLTRGVPKARHVLAGIASRLSSAHAIIWYEPYDVWLQFTSGD